MIIFLHPNVVKAESNGITKKVVNYLSSHDSITVTQDSIAESLGTIPYSQMAPSKINYAITIGGDGTLLHFVHQYPEIEAPILGINLGSLGFMTDLPENLIEEGLKELLSEECTIEKRMMLEGSKDNGKKALAVNEFSFHRGRNSSLVHLSVTIDDRFLNTFTADGIIIATPNGSTAYSLAAGGPIVSPDLSALVITPICAHTISNRPIILMPKEKITVEILNKKEPIDISSDGIFTSALSKNEIFTITPSKKKFQVVVRNNHDHFATLRTKLGWGWEKRYTPSL